MTMRMALIFAATALASANGLAQTQAGAQKDVPASQSPPPPEMKALVESCSAHKFETTVEVIVDGKRRGSKVKLCGKEGQTNAEWASTLKDAARKVEANATMPQAVKVQIITAINAEISKIETVSTVVIAPPVAMARPAERPPEYSILPPLPTAPVVAKKSLPARQLPAPRKPRLTIRCLAPGEPGGGGPCFSLEKNTLLTVRADENLAGGTRLRFLRRGNERGEVTLAQMRQGQSFRSRLPKGLCSGVVRSDVQIQIIVGTANQVADTLGPYDLRC